MEGFDEYENYEDYQVMLRRDRKTILIQEKKLWTNVIHVF